MMKLTNPRTMIYPIKSGIFRIANGIASGLFSGAKPAPKPVGVKPIRPTQ